MPAMEAVRGKPDSGASAYYLPKFLSKDGAPCSVLSEQSVWKLQIVGGAGDSQAPCASLCALRRYGQDRRDGSSTYVSACNDPNGSMALCLTKEPAGNGGFKLRVEGNGGDASVASGYLCAQRAGASDKRDGSSTYLSVQPDPRAGLVFDKDPVEGGGVGFTLKVLGGGASGSGFLCSFRMIDRDRRDDGSTYVALHNDPSGRNALHFTELEGKAFRLDNSRLGHAGAGMSFRKSKDNNNKEANKIATWDSLMVGLDEGDDWVKVYPDRSLMDAFEARDARDARDHFGDAPRFSNTTTHFQANLPGLSSPGPSPTAAATLALSQLESLSGMSIVKPDVFNATAATATTPSTGSNTHQHHQVQHDLAREDINTIKRVHEEHQVSQDLAREDINKLKLDLEHFRGDSGHIQQSLQLDVGKHSVKFHDIDDELRSVKLAHDVDVRARQEDLQKLWQEVGARTKQALTDLQQQIHERVSSELQQERAAREEAAARIKALEDEVRELHAHSATRLEEEVQALTASNKGLEEKVRMLAADSVVLVEALATSSEAARGRLDSDLRAEMLRMQASLQQKLDAERVQRVEECVKVAAASNDMTTTAKNKVKELAASVSKNMERIAAELQELRSLRERQLQELEQHLEDQLSVKIVDSTKTLRKELADVRKTLRDELQTTKSDLREASIARDTASRGEYSAKLDAKYSELMTYINELQGDHGSHRAHTNDHVEQTKDTFSQFETNQQDIARSLGELQDAIGRVSAEHHEKHIDVAATSEGRIQDTEATIASLRVTSQRSLDATSADLKEWFRTLTEVETSTLKGILYDNNKTVEAEIARMWEAFYAHAHDFEHNVPQPPTIHHVMVAKPQVLVEPSPRIVLGTQRVLRPTSPVPSPASVSYSVRSTRPTSPGSSQPGSLTVAPAKGATSPRGLGQALSPPRSPKLASVGPTLSDPVLGLQAVELDAAFTRMPGSLSSSRGRSPLGQKDNVYTFPGLGGQTPPMAPPMTAPPATPEIMTRSLPTLKPPPPGSRLVNRERGSGR